MKNRDKIPEILSELLDLERDHGGNRDLDIKLALSFGGFSYFSEGMGWYFDTKDGMRFRVSPGSIPWYTSNVHDAINLVEFAATGAVFYTISNIYEGLVGGHANVSMADSPYNSICDCEGGFHSVANDRKSIAVALLIAFFISLSAVPVDAEKPPVPKAPAAV